VYGASRRRDANGQGPEPCVSRSSGRADLLSGALPTWVLGDRLESIPARMETTREQRCADRPFGPLIVAPEIASVVAPVHAGDGLTDNVGDTPCGNRSRRIRCPSHAYSTLLPVAYVANVVASARRGVLAE
jgi:hypothetical protein